MLMVAVLAIALVIVGLTGGSIGRLSEIRLERAWLIFVALGVQVAVTSSLARYISEGLSQTVHLASYALILAFLVTNRRFPGIKVLTVGTLLNALAIAANHGTMPASSAAQRSAGIAGQSGFANSAVVPHPRLPFLGDVFAVPARFPLANVFSVGDVLIVTGAFVFIVITCRRPEAAQDPAPEDTQPPDIEATARS